MLCNMTTRRAFLQLVFLMLMQQYWCASKPVNGETSPPPTRFQSTLMQFSLVKIGHVAEICTQRLSTMRGNKETCVLFKQALHFGNTILSK